jgi:hypothetical protein
LLLAAACGVDDLNLPAAVAGTRDEALNDSSELRPSGKHELREASREAKPQGGGKGTGINYHGGPVMLGTVNVYYIWYGNWSGNTATSILEDLATNIGGSPYFDINTSYFNGAGTHVSGLATFAGSTTDSYSHGTSLTDAAVAAIVSSAITNHTLPSDSNGVYFVLTSADVNETTGFCKSYCGWHDNQSVGGADIKYAFVGNPDRCPTACEEQTVSPNNNAGADGMASIISHELEESVTDPDGNAWYDTRGNENADKCAWTFGTEFTESNGSKANVTLGPRDYLIQQNWKNTGSGGCGLSL